MRLLLRFMTFASHRYACRPRQTQCMIDIAAEWAPAPMRVAWVVHIKLTQAQI
jgi:hypothetical protein